MNARANAYRILAATLTGPPDNELLERISELPVDKNADDACGRALLSLKQAAKEDSESAAEDYQELLIGLGRGKVVPYGSWHISGNMMDKPLSALREDLKQLGLSRQQEAHEPEDHAGALCETMAVLCEEETGSDSAAALAHSRQQKIFSAHMAPWFEEFFADMAIKSEGGFYRSVGQFGAAFSAFERRYFEMPF